jgi:hypothetical protein
MSSLPLVLEIVRSHGFAVFTRGDLNLNLVAVRTRRPLRPDPELEDTFNDRFFCVYKKKDQWISRSWSCTTDPGLHFLRNPISNEKGTGCLYAPQQVRNAYEVGRHRGKYTALVQKRKKNASVKVYRDRDRSNLFDFDLSTVEPGWGFNVHRSSTKKDGASRVSRFSAGCVVFQRPDDFASLVSICKKSAAKFGNGFSLSVVDAPPWMVTSSWNGGFPTP